eukprot:scaffold29590_cov36-Phaeocystis_antarctica.AAC.2
MPSRPSAERCALTPVRSVLAPATDAPTHSEEGTRLLSPRGSCGAVPSAASARSTSSAGSEARVIAVSTAESTAGHAPRARSFSRTSESKNSKPPVGPEGAASHAARSNGSRRGARISLPIACM